MYDDFFDLKPNSKEMALGIIVVFILLVVIFCAGYLFGIRNAGKDLPNNGDPAASVRAEIDAAGSSVSTAVTRIDNAAAAADRVEARISDAQERAEYLKGTADEGRRLIAECQSILREVRAGGKEKAPKN